MPPRKKKGSAPAPKRNGPYKMPPPFPQGEVLKDFDKKHWVLGVSVGKGGFGEIYLAALQGSSASASGAEYVIKIEPKENGPLFTELSFYHRVAKPDKISKWEKDHGLDYLSIPKYIASGLHERDGMMYRFMVMQRFGEDLEKKFSSVGRKFGMKTVCYLALHLLDALKYLHESEYVHADIKGSNLLTGYKPADQHKLYLVDYGLAYRYNPCGKHKEYKEDPRKAHDGTIEFTSIDAHKGASPSRRGDLEILGYCLLQWACGRLPWEDNLLNKPYVAAQKIKYKSDVAGLMRACFTDSPVPKCLQEYIRYVYHLRYDEAPDYDWLKGLFHAGKGSLKDLDWLPSRKRRSEDELEGDFPSKKPRALPPAKKGASSSRPRTQRASPESPKESRRKPTVRSKGKSLSKRLPRDSSSSEVSPRSLLPQVSYPAELGYSNGSPPADKKATGKRKARRAVLEDSDDDEWSPTRKKATGKRRTVLEVSDDDEWSPTRKRVPRRTKRSRPLGSPQPRGAGKHPI